MEEGERKIRRDRQIDRQKDRQTDRQTDMLNEVVQGFRELTPL